MTSTYAVEAAKVSSQKIVLAHIEPEEKLVLFTLDSGSTFRRDVDFYVINLFEDGVALVEASSSTLSSGEFFFDAPAKRVFIRTTDDSNPDTKTIKVTYRLFFANAPVTLPHDLTLTGTDVEYEARLDEGGSFNKEIDEEQIGVALETATSVRLNNKDGFFDDIYDTLFFEFKDISIFSYFLNTPLTEKQLLFEGIIQDKRFNENSVSFSCKDFLHRLREPVQLSRFTTSDGDVPEFYLGTPKRRLYGQFKQLNLAPIDATLDGFDLTGTVSGTFGATTITGSGTLFLDEVSPRDIITFTQNNQLFEFEVDTVDSDTSITLQDELDTSFTSIAVINNSERPWRKKNRDWHIAGHKLREPITTISAVTGVNRVEVVNVSDFFADDLIDVNGEDVFIKRISGDEIILNQALQTGPSVSDPVTKNPVSKVFLNTAEAFINRDWTVTNGTSDSILVLEELAEFNVAKTRSIPGSFTFTNGSRTITATGVDLRNDLKPRDWIRSDDITHTVFYEILDVSESSLVIRIAYGGLTTTDDAKIKQPNLIDENSLITCNCIGLERNSLWVKTASDAVKDLVVEDAGFTNINTASFVESDTEAPFILSYPIPLEYGSDPPKIIDVITRINKSVFGSLVNNTAWELTYNVLSPEKPADMTTIEQDDVIGQARISSKNEIVRKVNAKFRPFVDIFTGERSFDLFEFTNEFVDDFIDAKAELDVELFLFNESDATSITQRYAMFNSLSQSTVQINTKLQLSLKNLNDKIFIKLDRLYKRFGNRTRRKIGIINKISKDGLNTTVVINDLGNSFNRVASIADDTAVDFTSATEDEKIFNGYIVDDDTELPDSSSDVEIFTNLIG